MTSVFIIMNEWTDDDTDFECIYGDQFWLSEAGAVVKLAELAYATGSELEEGATAFDSTAAHHDGLERDTYYIRELTQR